MNLCKEMSIVVSHNDIIGVTRQIDRYFSSV